jgi:hypothetical protein
MTFLHARQTPPAFSAPSGAIPASFLIAPDGSIAASGIGEAAWDDRSVVAFLERLAGPAAVPPATDSRR